MNNARNMCTKFIAEIVYKLESYSSLKSM